jgi:ribosomal protein S18 acetylase RimI-like enzyme
MIDYTHSADGIVPDRLQGFFVGWPNPPDPETHLRLLRGSDEIVLAIDSDSGQVIGFVNAVTDGVLAAYIPLLEVLPEYQKRGIGRELMLRLLGRLNDLYMIDLLCDRDVQPFYQKVGFTPMSAMMIRNFEAQCGRQQSGQR